MEIAGGCCGIPAEVAACFGVLKRTHEGRPVTAADVERLRRWMTDAYVGNGYHTSGVLLRDDGAGDGVARFEAVSGRVADIRVVPLNDAPGWLSSEYVGDRLAAGTAVPFRLDDLRNRVLQLYQDPAIEKIAVDIRPGDRIGEAVIDATYRDVRPLTLTAVASNGQSPSLGEWYGQTQATLRDAFGIGDVIEARLGRTGGVEDGGIAATVPIGLDDTTLSFRIDRSASQVIRGATRDLDIESRTRTVEIGVTQGAFRAADSRVTFGATLASRDNRTSLLDEPFSFSAGAVDGRTRISVLRLSQNMERWADHDAMALQSVFSFGLGVLGRTRTDDTTNGKFAAWFGRFSFSHWLSAVDQLVARAEIQLADGPLYPMEQYAVGGRYTVRGYRESEAVRDDGVNGSVEARLRVLEWLPNDPTYGGSVFVVPFVDAGRAWNRRGRHDGSGGVSLASVGAGVRWQGPRWLEGEVFYGHPLVERASDDYSFQSQGVHLRVTSRWSF